MGEEPSFVKLNVMDIRLITHLFWLSMGRSYHKTIKPLGPLIFILIKINFGTNYQPFVLEKKLHENLPIPIT